MRLVFNKFRICVPHLFNQRRIKFRKQCPRMPKQLTMSHRTTQNTANHITAVSVRRNYTIGNRKTNRTQVVGNNLETCFVFVRLDDTGNITNGAFKVHEQIGIIVIKFSLKHGRPTFQPRTGINILLWQWRQISIRIAVILHENIVPNFNETPTIFVRCSRQPARNIRTKVIENFTARATWTGVARRPPVIFVQTNRVFAGNLFPNLGCFVIRYMRCYNKSRRVQSNYISQQIPRHFNCTFLEIITKRPIPHHFKESMMPTIKTNIF